jgi:prepilin peptidase CpaA
MQSFAWWPTLIALAVATFTDLRSRRIPNWLVAPFFVSGVAASAWLHGWHGLGQSFAGCGLGILMYGFLFWMGGMGAGDVKLAAAIGAWIGPNQLFFALVVTAMAGGLMALCWAAFGGFLKDLFTGAGDLAFGWRDSTVRQRMVLDNPKTRKMPYAPAIAIGTLLSFFAH